MEAFQEVEPFGDEWRQTAVVAQILAESHRNRKKRSQPYKIEDFIPRRVRRSGAGGGGEKPAQGWWKQLRVVETLTRFFGGSDVRSEAKKRKTREEAERSSRGSS